MNFPQFWARGESGDFFAWRWSEKGVADAQLLADQAAQQIAERFRHGHFPPKHGGYYPDRPFREQILQELKDVRGQVSHIVTRNSYGCHVLNTAKIMFVDIDLPEPPPPPGLLSRLFGKPQVPPPIDPKGQAMNKIERWTRSNPEWGWRIYQTRSGLRLLATQGPVDAKSETTNAVFDALGADPLYRKLCSSQDCFRARLTPKPWRCGLRSKPERWPWLDAKHESRFQKWETKYQSCCINFATCRFLRQLGNPTIHPDVHVVVKIHDTSTRAESGLQLA